MPAIFLIHIQNLCFEEYIFRLLIKFVLLCHPVLWLPVLVAIFLVPRNLCMKDLPASASREHAELYMQVL